MNSVRQTLKMALLSEAEELVDKEWCDPNGVRHPYLNLYKQILCPFAAYAGEDIVASDLHEMRPFPSPHLGNKYGTNIKPEHQMEWAAVAHYYYRRELCLLVSNQHNITDADTEEMRQVAVHYLCQKYGAEAFVQATRELDAICKVPTNLEYLVPSEA